MHRCRNKMKSFCGCWCLGSPSVVKKFRVATRRIYGFWGQQKRVVEHCKQRDEIDKKISRRQFTRQLWYHSKKTKITVNNCWSCGCTVSMTGKHVYSMKLLIDRCRREEGKNIKEISDFQSISFGFLYSIEMIDPFRIY